MKKEVIKEIPKKELNQDQKIIKGWIIASLSIVLAASLIVGSVFLKAHSVAKENDLYTKEEAYNKATTYINQRSSTYKNKEYDTKIKSKLVFHIGEMEKAQHVYYITFDCDEVHAVVKVDGVTKKASLIESSVETIY